MYIPNLLPAHVNAPSLELMLREPFFPGSDRSKTKEANSTPCTDL
jgi:hypothetical protein